MLNNVFLFPLLFTGEYSMVNESRFTTGKNNQLRGKQASKNEKSNLKEGQHTQGDKSQ